MGPTLDTTFVYRIWVNTESVQYFSRGPGSVLPAKGVTVNYTRRLVIKKDFLPPDSWLLQMDTQWCFPVYELKGMPVKVEDVFQDCKGQRWIIKRTEDHESSIKVSCLKLQGVA